MEAITLNGTWQCLPVASDNDINYADPMQQYGAAWQEIEVPQNWYLAGVEHRGRMWFRRSIAMPLNDTCSVWWLEFDGVDYKTEVWMNGRRVGEHVGYFDRFRFDVTEFIATGENMLVLRVDCPDEQENLTHQISIRGVIGQESLAWNRPWDVEAAQSSTGGIWGDVLLKPYDCENPPEVDDWYEPLAKSVVSVDEHTQEWMRGDAPFFPRGTLYIPGRHLSALTRESYERDIRMMKDANLNIVRVYGHVLPDDFYTVCDEMGMLVWQDFPLYGGYDDSREFQQEALRQLERMIKQLGHHVCIAAWGIHVNSPWLTATKRSYQNRKLDEQLLARAREIDPNRYVTLDSLSFERDAMPRGDIMAQVEYPDVPLPLVFGKPALPVRETMQDAFPAGSGESAFTREFLIGDFIDWERHESLDDLVESSQSAQALAVKYAIEYRRSRKAAGVNGIFHHFFVDTLPAVSNAVVDFWRRPKPAYHALKSAMQPLLPIAILPLDRLPLLPANQNLMFDIVVVNDLPERFTRWTCKVSMTGWIPSGKESTENTYMHHWSQVFKDVTIEPCGRVDLGMVNIPPFKRRSTEYHLVLQLFDLEDERRDAIVNTYVLRVED